MFNRSMFNIEEFNQPPGTAITTSGLVKVVIVDDGHTDVVMIENTDA